MVKLGYHYAQVDGSILLYTPSEIRQNAIEVVFFEDRLYSCGASLRWKNTAVVERRVSISNLCISGASIPPFQPGRYYTPINSRNRISQGNRAT